MTEPAWSYYQQRYYDYQTTARGLLTVDQLTTAFKRSSIFYQDRLQRWLPSDKSSLCLDIPCGFGNFLYFLRKLGYENCYGYDLDPKQVALAQSLGLRAECKDAFEILKQREGDVALIASLDFLEHLNKNLAVQFLEACFRSLEPNGTLILQMPCSDGPFGSHDRYNDITHEWGASSNALRCLLEMTGFVSVNFVQPTPTRTIVGVSRWILCRISRGIVSILLHCMMLQTPTVWEPSMLAVARKPVAHE
jgi:SAM-dependent methyltransferase